MVGLVPGIHVFSHRATSFRGDAKHRTRDLEIPGSRFACPGMTASPQPNKTWMAGTSPAMTSLRLLISRLMTACGLGPGFRRADAEILAAKQKSPGGRPGLLIAGLCDPTSSHPQASLPHRASLSHPAWRGCWRPGRSVRSWRYRAAWRRSRPGPCASHKFQSGS